MSTVRETLRILFGPVFMLCGPALRVLPVLSASLVLAACASSPPAPVESRTTPAGGHLSASPVRVQPAPVVPARPSSAAPVQSAGTAAAWAPQPAAVAAGSAARPAASSPARPAAEVNPNGPTGPVSAVQTTPLVAPAIESRAIESRPLEARPLEARPAASSASASAITGAAAPSTSALAPASPAAPLAAKPLVTPAAGSAPAAPQVGGATRGDVDFAWPVPGRVLQGYTETGKGIALSGSAGEPVFAAAEGRVIFSGNGPRGYGNLIIVKHANELLSVYAHNSKLLVKEGQSVARGERIAELGDTGGTSPRLHFEIRRQGKPVDPLPYLPRR